MAELLTERLPDTEGEEVWDCEGVWDCTEVPDQVNTGLPVAIDDGDAAAEVLSVTVGLWAIVWVNDATLVLVLDTIAVLLTVMLPDTEGEDVWDCEGVLDSLFCAELLTLDECVISEVSDDLIEGLVIELAEILYTLLTVGVASGVLDSVVI